MASGAVTYDCDCSSGTGTIYFDSWIPGKGASGKYNYALGPGETKTFTFEEALGCFVASRCAVDKKWLLTQLAPTSEYESCKPMKTVTVTRSQYMMDCKICEKGHEETHYNPYYKRNETEYVCDKWAPKMTTD